MDDRDALAAVWPLFGLSVRTPRVVLRYPTDSDLLALAALSGDIHAADYLPFQGTWSKLPDGERQQTVLQYHWGRRGGWSTVAWRLELVVLVEDEVVGTQAVHGDDFAITRTVTTGSWLGRAHQGKGIGTEMRSASLHLAFAGLGADRAETDAYEDNSPSLGVTAKLGYQPNGDQIAVADGQRRRTVRFVLDRADWEATRRGDIEVSGVEACRPLFGLGAAEGDAVT
jgi:RimJ/RimL family protein N-acetyltransferase